MSKKTVILVNTGTPDSPRVADVRKYLRQFLTDKRVISIPWLARQLLVNLVIAPFRAPKSAQLYQKLWTEKGSPLLFHTQSLAAKLQSSLGPNFIVKTGMRYGQPSLQTALEQASGSSEIIMVPLFPQYASSTSGSAVEMTYCQLAKKDFVPTVRIVGQFYYYPGFVDAFTSRILKMSPANYDHVLFSFHSLPMAHIDAMHPGSNCDESGCRQGVQTGNETCYQATCYYTAKLLAESCDIEKGDYSISFQSRFAKKWLGPFTDDMMMKLLREGKKKILVVCPGFVADCLETTVEIGYEYRNRFLAAGGVIFDMVESLNDEDIWVKTLQQIIENKHLSTEK